MANSKADIYVMHIKTRLISIESQPKKIVVVVVVVVVLMVVVVVVVRVSQSFLLPVNKNGE